MYGQMADMKDSLLPLPQEPFWIRHFLNENDVCVCTPDQLVEDEHGYKQPRDSLANCRKVDVVFSRSWEPRTIFVSAKIWESELSHETDIFYQKIN
jgi:hypothetical protein